MSTLSIIDYLYFSVWMSCIAWSWSKFREYNFDAIKKYSYSANSSPSSQKFAYDCIPGRGDPEIDWSIVLGIVIFGVPRTFCGQLEKESFFSTGTAHYNPHPCLQSPEYLIIYGSLCYCYYHYCWCSWTTIGHVLITCRSVRRGLVVVVVVKS